MTCTFARKDVEADVTMFAMTDQTPAPDLGALYRMARTRFAQAVRTLDDATLAKRPPATPDWTARDLAGHAAGVVNDVTEGRVEGAGSDEWTAKQVEAARGEQLEVILARWEEQAPNVEALLTNAPPSMMTARLVIDMVTHEYDLAGLTGQAPQRCPAFEFARDGYASAFGYRIRKAGLPAVELSDGDWTYAAGEGEPEVRVTADQVELFRALSGRRSADQIRAWNWDGDPGPYLAIVSNFGSLAEVDVDEAFA